MKNIEISNKHTILPKTFNSKVCSASPTIFDAFIVYFPKWLTKILGITRLHADVLGLFSNLTPSFSEISLSLRYHDTLALGMASIIVSNLIDFPWMATVSIGLFKKIGAPKYD